MTTVADLIEQLKKMPADLPVEMASNFGPCDLAGLSLKNGAVVLEGW